MKRNGIAHVANLAVALVCILAGISTRMTAQISFTAGTYPVGSGPSGIAVADLNNDGWLDLITANDGSQDVSILLNDKSGHFGAAAGYAVSGRPYQIAAGDFDEDGDSDLAVTLSWYANKVTLLRNSGNGTFALHGYVNVAGDAHPIAATDIDLDGHIDLIIGMQNPDRISTFRGNGAGGFTASQDLPVGHFPEFTVVTDFNGDAWPDLVVLTEEKPGRTVSLFTNNGAGIFQLMKDISLNYTAYAFGVADFDLDGKLDIAVPKSPPVSLLMGVMESDWTVVFTPDVGNDQNYLTISDLDRNGASDILVPIPPEDRVACLRNDGSGSFQVAGSTPTGHNPRAIISADLDRDGYDDFATANGGSNDVTIGLQVVPPGAISGSVTSGGSPMPGVTVKLLDANGLPIMAFDPVVTVAGGHYSFAGVMPATYQVMIVEPLGYLPEQNPQFATVHANQTTTVNFRLTPIPTTNSARGKGYWKHQFDVQVSGRGSSQETNQQLASYVEGLHSHYTYHWGTFSGVESFEEWQAVLSNRRSESMADRAKQELAALVFNVVSLKLGQLTVVTADGRTAADVMTYVSQLILDDAQENDALAKDLAESVNCQIIIGAGIVPQGGILYRTANAPIVGSGMPASFIVLGNYPNPFNPSTTIRYGLPTTSRVKITIFNSLGARVTQLVDEENEAGYHEVRFNASGLSSGVYFYRLQAGEFVHMSKILLVK